MNRYQNTPILKTNTGKQYYASTRYPEIPRTENDIYVFTTEGDRFDTLSQQYYRDSSLWWIIAIANPDLNFNTLFIPAGTQLRIPSNIGEILFNYETINSL
jgi:phage tail protein X